MTTRFTPEQYKAMAEDLERVNVSQIDPSCIASMLRQAAADEVLIEDLQRRLAEAENRIETDAKLLEQASTDASRNDEPVAEVVSSHGDPNSFGNRHIESLRDISVLPYGTKLYAAPQAKPAANILDSREILTYKNQPGNVGAWGIGEALSKASKNQGGDYIDGGLSLLKELQEKGYGIISLTSRNPRL